MAQEHMTGLRTGIDDGLKDRQFMHMQIKAVDEGKKKKTMKDIIDEKKFSEKMQPKEEKDAEQSNQPVWLGKKKTSKAKV